MRNQPLKCLVFCRVVLFFIFFVIFYCHIVLLLAIKSLVFKAMFASTMTEQFTSTVTIIDFPQEIVNAMLTCLYMPKLSSRHIDEKCMQLYAIAHKYEIDEIKTQCVNYMLTSFATHTEAGYTWFELLDFAEFYQIASIKRAVFFRLKPYTSNPDQMTVILQLMTVELIADFIQYATTGKLSR